MLGDCILHLDHHEMADECWGPVIDHFMATVNAHPDADPDALHLESVRGYKAAYERALLDAIRSSPAERQTIRTEQQ